MTTRKYHWAMGVLVMLLTILLLSSSPADAQNRKKKQKKPKAPQTLFFDIDLSLTYDDNVIRYSDADLDLFDQNAAPGKFDIESRNDWVIKPRMEGRLKGRFIGGHTAWIGVNYRYYYFARNNVRRYHRMSVFARHYFFRGGYLESEYYFIPDYYYRNQYVQNLGYVKASFTKHFLKFEIGQDITSSLKADISYRYQSKAYNPEVSERDLTENGVRIDAIWRAAKSVKFWAYYGFVRANAAGADLPAPEVRDVSYDAWDITLGARYYSSLHRKLKPEFFSTVQFEEIKFRTVKYLDEYRFDRDDHNLELAAGTVLTIWYGVRLDISYSYYQKRTDLPVRANENLLEYTGSSVSIGLQRDF